jgi:phosphoribosylanthranilate isomerase
MVRVKICGMTSTAEAQLAARHGAHAVGVLVGRMHASPDFVEPDVANAIARSLPPFITTVLVTHEEQPDTLVTLAGAVSCSVVQLHSDLDSATLHELRMRLSPRKIIGKVSVEGEVAVERAREIEACVDAIVLDSCDRATDRVGGTGMVHDWSVSARITASCKVPIILAGGLTPENVAQAISVVKPWAVDVHSGVESRDGRKDEDRIRRFTAAAFAAQAAPDQLLF